jgi:hypothetical protein
VNSGEGMCMQETIDSRNGALGGPQKIDATILKVCTSPGTKAKQVFTLRGVLAKFPDAMKGPPKVPFASVDLTGPIPKTKSALSKTPRFHSCSLKMGQHNFGYPHTGSEPSRQENSADSSSVGRAKETGWGSTSAATGWASASAATGWESAFAKPGWGSSAKSLPTEAARGQGQNCSGYTCGGSEPSRQDSSAHSSAASREKETGWGSTSAASEGASASTATGWEIAFAKPGWGSSAKSLPPEAARCQGQNDSGYACSEAPPAGPRSFSEPSRQDSSADSSAVSGRKETGWGSASMATGWASASAATGWESTSAKPGWGSAQAKPGWGSSEAKSGWGSPHAKSGWGSPHAKP